MPLESVAALVGRRPERLMAASAPRSPAPLGLLALNLGGPGSLDDVEPFLRRLFGDPDVIQLGWARPLQPLLAWSIARWRASFSRAGLRADRRPLADPRGDHGAGRARSPMCWRRAGSPPCPVVAMAAWHPLADDALADAGRARRPARRGAAALPARVAHHDRTRRSARSRRPARHHPGLEIAAVKRYPDAEGYLQAVVERIEEARARCRPSTRATAPVLFSAHGLPEAYIRRGDPYLDDIRITVEAVARRHEPRRARASLLPEPRRAAALARPDDRGDARRAGAPPARRAVIVVPIAFTGEHIETLQEIDILYRERAEKAGIVHFARARTVGTHPAFIAALADLAENAARAEGWV